jgi:hypothetical protein
MIELIRASAVPATLVHSAARGALALPPAEMIEILVHLANHNKIFGQQARMTLAGWEEKSSLAAASDPKTSREVLEYLVSPDNLRPVLLQALLENPAVPEPALVALAASGSRDVLRTMLASERVQRSAAIRNALNENPNHPVSPSDIDSAASASPSQGAESNEHIGNVKERAEAAEEPKMESDSEQGEPTEVLDEQIMAFFTEHAAEIEAEGVKPFQPLGGIDELELVDVPSGPDSVPDSPPESQSQGVTPETPGAAVPAGVPAHAGHKHAARPHGAETKRGSALQKISKMDIKGRIQLAMKGTKEERSILIRDGTKIVALAVLESPKVTDGEVEAFASQKNVLEAVLRAIPMKRRYAKHYPIIRNLVSNPRTPIDVSLGLMKNLLVADLRHLSSNKQVSETVRKLALKMFKQKMDTTKKSSD